MHAIILIKQMATADDAQDVAAVLLGLEGVNDVKTDLNQQTVHVALSNEGEDTQLLVEAVENAGYTVDRIEMEMEH